MFSLPSFEASFWARGKEAAKIHKSFGLGTRYFDKLNIHFFTTFAPPFLGYPLTVGCHGIN
jgi:hypothetical protein